MSVEPIQVRKALLDSLQVDHVGPFGGLGDDRELLSRSPSRWYLTGFLVPTDAGKHQLYDPNRDDELDQAPAVATVDENQTLEEEASKRICLPSSVFLKIPPLADTAADRHALEITQAIFQKLVDANDDLASASKE